MSSTSSAATISTREALKKYFGFDSFRPFQEEIIDEALTGRDVLALLPTGGGKSLCFQLPAVLSRGLTLVVSPLIALMKDQVDALDDLGIAATFLNSTLEENSARERWRGLNSGKYRLLYVAPERLMLDNFLEEVKKWNVSLIAIDEAHCISEWGHDFRPEYRELARLRELFPAVPVMALTATATGRVRSDITSLLKLQNPKFIVASFNRPNLLYRVIPKANPLKQIVDFLSDRRNESGIIYCQSRKSTEAVADHLKEQGISALPYHAGLDANIREKHQDLFIRDEVPIIVATIAFGMGVDKPNVRFVIHRDLPKNIESYYQETGRAGRDGLPSECLLLYSASDVAKLYQFIEQKTDAQEQNIARQQLSQMVRFAEDAYCRRVLLLRYFGEEYRHENGSESNCSSCDNCLTPREKVDGTLLAQKFLSCIYRIREMSGFGVGMHHVIEVLTGAQTEKIQKFGHAQLSTYGIGKDVPRANWLAHARELIQLGLVLQNAERFNVLELTDAGWRTLRERSPVSLTKPFETARLSTEKRKKAASHAGAIEYNEVLFQRLRALRKQIADSKRVPAYVVFSDVTLREMAAQVPKTKSALLAITGIGEKKLQEYGASFLKEIQDFDGMK